MENLKNLKSSTIYQIFPRNYSSEGTFNAITKDIKRIKDLGVSIIYLMPINEIGKKNRKGTYGSPYATKDYFSISHDLGTKEDLIKLIEEVHNNGMKIILDMVFNHTAPDCVLFDEHPDYYFLKDGKPGNRVGDWSDIIDLATEKPEVQDYLISVLKYWSNIGFDGYRFDVASMVPLPIFKKAREELGEDAIFLAESIDTDFNEYLHSEHLYAAYDEDLIPTFDILYNYNSFLYLKEYLKTKKFSRMIEFLDANFKEYKNNPSMLRINCLENHDHERVGFYFESDYMIKNITALSFILKGPGFIYAGQEYVNKHKPELFEKDPVDWKIDDYFGDYFKKLVNIKKDYLGEMENYSYVADKDNEIIRINLSNDKNEVIALINLSDDEKAFDLPVGKYKDLLTGKTLNNKDTYIVTREPVILFK